MTLLKDAVRRLSRNKVIKRRLPVQFGSGTIYVSPDSALTYLRPSLESDLFNAVAKFVKPGDHVWDVGSNVGLLAYAAAARVGPTGGVLAVEADSFLVSLLRKTAKSNPAPPEILCVAISDRLGIAKFNIAQNGRSSNFLSSLPGAGTDGGVRYSEEVMTVTLDWLLQHRPPPKFVKIDIEGAELLALRGAKILLNETRPVLLVELSAKDQAECVSILKQANYTLEGWGETQQERFCNFVAIPSERKPSE